MKPNLNKSPRSGLRIKGRSIDPDVHAAVKRYAVWLRTQFEFPIRVPAYFSRRRRLTTISGEIVSASIFLPYDTSIEPYIRVATGDYIDDKRERGRDNAIAVILCSLSHEVIHYSQWINTGTFTERGVAAVRARGLVDKYAMTVDHP